MRYIDCVYKNLCNEHVNYFGSVQSSYTSLVSSMIEVVASIFRQHLDIIILDDPLADQIYLFLFDSNTMYPFFCLFCPFYFEINLLLKSSLHLM